MEDSTTMAGVAIPRLKDVMTVSPSDVAIPRLKDVMAVSPSDVASRSALGILPRTMKAATVSVPSQIVARMPVLPSHRSISVGLFEELPMDGLESVGRPPILVPPSQKPHSRMADRR